MVCSRKKIDSIYFFGMPKGKRKSRKGKKAWRKNVDVQEEEDIGRLRETSDNQLFVVDKPSKIIARSRQEHKQLIATSTLFEDKLSTPIGKNKVESIQKKTETNKYIQKISDRLEKEKKQVKSDRSKSKQTNTSDYFDLWGTDEIPKVNPNVIKRHKQVKETLPQSELTKVLPGQSYHPKASDHQKLLQEALDQITDKLEPELRATEKLKPTTKVKESDVEVKWNYSDSEDDEEEKPTKTDEFEDHMKEINRHYSTKFTTTQRNKINKRKKEILRRRIANRSGKTRNIDRYESISVLIKQ